MSNIFRTITSQSDNTLILNSILLFNKEFNILVCTSCKYCITKSSLDSHIKRFHPYKYSSIDILDLKKQLEQFNIKNEKDIETPNNNTVYFEYLNVYNNTNKCNFCDHITNHTKSIRQHLNIQHNFKQPKNKNDDIGYTSNLPSQSFFKGLGFKLFTIIEPSTSIQDIGLFNPTSNELLNLEINNFQATRIDILNNQDSINRQDREKHLSSF